jgi:guanylate kinase
LVLSSPSGGGKTSIAKRLLTVRGDVVHSVSATTRATRDGEVDGQSYWFISRAEFEREVAEGAFLEWAEYGGNLYGTLRREVDRGRAAGKHVVLDIEVQGAEQLRGSVPDAVHVFVLPPSGAELVKRLEGRKTETAAVIAKRLSIAAMELGRAGQYDYVVVNDDLDQATAQVVEIIAVECRRPSRLRGLAKFVGDIRETVERSKP